ncbi:UNVERIFIED_CONTAM: hypothetical protein GTU68_067356 [Idotea baltica]|nr:hypothetical protein [Idotea baltica]
MQEPFTSCFLVDIKCSKKKFEVYIDSDGALSLGTCTQISRQLESQLDEDPQVPDDYLIEVSSPGISRPLKFNRQYSKHLSRQLEITMVDKTTQKGILKEVADDGITIEIKRTEKQGKKKIKIIESKKIMFDHIVSTIVKASI